jgi:hypothetical protein
MDKGLNLETIDHLRKCVEEREKIAGPRIGDFIFMKDGSIQRFSHDWGDSIQTSNAGSFHLSSDGLVSFSGGLNEAIPKSSIKETYYDWADHSCAKGLTGEFWVCYNNRLVHGSKVNVNLECRVYRQN